MSIAEFLTALIRSNRDYKLWQAQHVFALATMIRERQVLDLRRYSITRLPSEIRLLTQLRELYISSGSFKYVAPEIGELQQLHTLEFIDSGAMPLKHLPDTIGHLSNLKILRLYFSNRFQLPATLTELRQLEVLDLKGCAIDTLSLHTFEQLKALSITVEYLPPGFEKLTNLETLVLNFSKFKQLPATIKHLKQLKVLMLNHSSLAELPPEIGQLEQLEELWLMRTKLTTLPPEIRHLKRLKKLLLSESPITTLPPEIGALTSLEELYLNHTHLRALPETIGNLHALRELALHKTNLEVIPASLKFLNHLEMLSLNNTALKLPEELIDPLNVQGQLAFLRDL